MTKKDWSKDFPSDDEIVNFVFNDSEIDDIDDFNYLARGNLITRKISKSEYLALEKCVDALRNAFNILEYEKKNLGDEAGEILADIIDQMGKV